MRGQRVGVTVFLAGGAALAVLHRLGRTWGATPDERRRPFPGDGLVPDPLLVTTHATTIDAPASTIWPWLVQMGWGRAGWYTAEWVDRALFPNNRPSAREIRPELQDLRVGDHILDGAPETECWFVVEELEPPRHLVLHSRSHLPPGFRDRFRAWIDWSWVFVLDEQPEGGTRFAFRSRANLGPRWLAAAYWLLVVPADFVMSRQMLRGVKARAEGALTAT